MKKQTVNEAKANSQMAAKSAAFVTPLATGPRSRRQLFGSRCWRRAWKKKIIGEEAGRRGSIFLAVALIFASCGVTFGIPSQKKKRGG